MDKFLFDTSSLLNFVKYYLPFDEDSKLKEFLLQGFNENRFLLLSEVKIECERVSSGLIFNELAELKKIKPLKQADIVNSKWHNLIDNNFSIKGMKSKLNQNEYEQQKSNFIKSADFALIFYASNNQNKRNPTIITEETINSNDNKIFKKIPAICEMQSIKCISLPQFLKKQISVKYQVLGNLFCASN